MRVTKATSGGPCTRGGDSSYRKPRSDGTRTRGRGRPRTACPLFRRRASRRRTAVGTAPIRNTRGRRRAARRSLPVRRAETRKHAAVHLEEAIRRRRVAGSGICEGAGTRIRRIAPHAVRLTSPDRVAHTKNAARKQEHGPEPPAVQRDRRPRGGEVVVHERLDAHALLEPVVRVARARRDESGKLETSCVVVDLIEPEEMLEPVILAEEIESRRPPVVGGGRSLDPQNDRLLGREGDARVVRVPDESHLARLSLRARMSHVSQPRAERPASVVADDVHAAPATTTAPTRPPTSAIRRSCTQDQRNGERGGKGKRSCRNCLATEERRRPADAGHRDGRSTERATRGDEKRRCEDEPEDRAETSECISTFGPVSNGRKTA